MIRQIRSRIARCFLLLLIPALVQGASSDSAGSSCVTEAFRRLGVLRNDTSVELELPMNRDLLSVVSTFDGTLAPVLGKREPPEFLATAFPGKDLRALKWDALGYDQKIELIKYASQGQEFYDNRKVPGLKTREVVQLKFSQPTEFLGKRYSAGSHLVDISKIMGPVEFSSPEALKGASGLELHFRVKRTAGETSNSAWTFVEGLGLKRNHQHVHIVSRVAGRRFFAGTDYRRQGQWLDFLRRTNLAAELLSVVELKMHVYHLAESFPIMTRRTFSQLAKDLIGWFKVRRPIIYKEGYVGFRPPGVYDDPEAAGLEYRGLGARQKPATMRAMLDGIQSTMETENLGLKKGQLDDWYRWRGHEPADKVQEDLLYDVTNGYYNHDDWAKMYAEAPIGVRKQLARMSREPGSAAFLDPLTKDRNEVKMLLNDWSRDPLFFRDPDAQIRIEQSQVQALRRIQRGEAPLEAVRAFAIDSGLYSAVLASVGVRVGTSGPQTLVGLSTRQLAAVRTSLHAVPVPETATAAETAPRSWLVRSWLGLTSKFRRPE